MKLWLTILMLGHAVLSYGQTLEGLRARLSLLEKSADFHFDTAGFSKLPKIDYRCDNKNVNTSDYYHVVDLDNDGRNDLIFSGPCETTLKTGIFLNTGRGFRRVYDNPGKIISIEAFETQTVINIFKEACCCEFFSQYTEVIIGQNSEVTRNTIVFGPNTRISVSSRLKEDKVMGTLRTTPQVNDVIKRDDCNNTIKGNQLTRIHGFKDVIQLNRDGPWWLVLYPENRERSWIGWMKLE
jgi:hypothetical protein